MMKMSPIAWHCPNNVDVNCKFHKYKSEITYFNCDWFDNTKGLTLKNKIYKLHAILFISLSYWNNTHHSENTEMV